MFGLIFISMKLNFRFVLSRPWGPTIVKSVPGMEKSPRFSVFSAARPPQTEAFPCVTWRKNAEISRDIQIYTYVISLGIGRRQDVLGECTLFWNGLQTGETNERYPKKVKRHWFFTLFGSLQFKPVQKLNSTFSQYFSRKFPRLHLAFWVENCIILLDDK